MTTSLARQLQGLKVVQKDEIKISRKSKVSFLFDNKEAYKIEDEVIYTLCMKGIKELSSQSSILGNQLDLYKDDIFGIESKDFYRGVQVQSDLDVLDSKLKQIITIISPYFMNTATFKVLEFLIRIYEVHVYHKLHVFFSFLPFYETPQFLRLIQCMELKSDPILKYFEPIASKGIKLRIEALVRFMSRENGAYLKLFSDITFKFLTLSKEQSLVISKAEKESSIVTNMISLNLEDSEPDENIPHYRFWTSLIFKIISTEESSISESFLYVLIPYFAKGLESRVRKLQTGVLSIILRFLDTSLHAKKLTFSEQYMNAFLIEICKSASISLEESKDPTYFGLCVKTCIRILQAQQTTERLNERLSTLSFNSKAKYISSENKELKKIDDTKWINNLLSHQDSFLKVLRDNQKVDFTSLLSKCFEYYLSHEIDCSEASKCMIKILATLEPSTELYKMAMAYMLAVLAGNLPEFNSERTSKFSVLILDYLESRDPCIYVQVLDTLLQGMNDKKLFLAELNKQMDLLGKAKVKTITIDSGMSQNESIPVVLALYHRKKNIKKAALLSLYQQWVDKNDISDGRDLRMITSMLIQFIEEKESEEILIITFALIEHLLTKEMLLDVLVRRLYNCLVNEFIPVYFPPCRQYSDQCFMKGVNLLLSLKHGDEFENMQILIYIICNLNESLRALLNDFHFKDKLKDDGYINHDSISLNHALELIVILIKNPKFSELQSGKIWNLFELYFSEILGKSENDSLTGCTTLLLALKETKNSFNFLNIKTICSIFIGKLPSLSNTDRVNKDRLRIHELIIEFLRIDSSLIPTIFETIIVKHLGCDITSIIDYMLILYYENNNYPILRTHCLLFINRTLNCISELTLRTQILATYFATFIIMLSDPEPSCRKSSINILKFYDNYESFTKVLKKDKLKSCSTLEFFMNKRKIYPIKRGKLLDELEDFIDDITNTHTSEILSDMTYASTLIKFEKNESLFEYFMYTISLAHTPNELNSLLSFIRTQKFNPKQMHIFSNVIVTIEFKSGLLGKEHSFSYIHSLIEILCNQNSKDDEISENVHDCLLGVLDQYNKKDYNISEHYVIKIIRKLVNITIEYSQRNQSIGESFDKVFKQIGTITDVVQDCMKNPEAPTFYLKMMTVDLLKSVPGVYISTILERFSDSLNSRLCNDLDTFRRILFLLDCCQSITLEFNNLSVILSLIHKLGDVISDIELHPTGNDGADLIEMLIVFINLAQNSLSEIEVVNQEQIKIQLGEYVIKLVKIFNLQLENLCNLYQEESKIKEIENIADPVEEFLMKDSLMTSAQKEREKKGIEDTKEDDKIQKDIVLYQSLSNILLLISNIQLKCENMNDESILNIYSKLSNCLRSLKDLEQNPQYSSQSLKIYIRQLLILQTSAFHKIALRSIENELINKNNEWNLFINKSIENYLSDIINFSETFDEKLKLIIQTANKILDDNQAKYTSLIVALLLKIICENPKIKLPSDIFVIENEEFKIAQEILYKCMKSHQSVQILTYMILLVSSVSIFNSSRFKDLNEKCNEFSKNKTALLFEKNNDQNNKIKDISQTAKWIDSLMSTQFGLSKLKYLFLILLEEIIPKQSHSEKYGEDRHPLVLHFAMLTKNLSDDIILGVTELILAFEFGTSLIEHQLHLINDLKRHKDPKKLKDIINDKQDAKIEQKLAKSIERLVDGYRRFNQDFVALLVPIKVYIPVVTNILGYNEELITLKTRSVNALSDIVMRGSFKMSDGIEQNEFEDDKRANYIDNNRIDAKLQELMKILIVKIGNILNVYCNNHKKKTTHAYLQSLIVLLQKLLCNKNQNEMETIILPKMQIIAKSEVNTMLSCSAIMFVVSAFDVYKTDIYNIKEDLVNEVIINQSIKNITKVLPGGSEENEYFSNSVIISILDSYSILMKGMFSQLFTPEQLTEILSIFFSIPESKVIGNSQIGIQIETISSLVAKNVTPQISLHSLFNIFDVIAIHPADYNNSEAKLNVYCQRYFNCITKILRQLKKDFIDEYYEGISKFFQKSFLIPQTWEKNTQTPLVNVIHIQNCVLNSFKAFVLKLNEIQLKPIFSKFVKWASKPLNKSAKPIKDLDRLYIFFKVVNCLLETLMSIFTPYLSQYINLLTELLDEAIEDNHTKSNILFMKEFTDPENSRLNIVMVLNTLLECIRLNYYYDTDSTIPVEYFQRISSSMIHSMDFYINHGTMDKTQYLNWIRNVYQKVIVDVLDSLDQVEITRDFLDDLLKNSKHENPAVRLAIMRITEALIVKLEERFLTLLSDVLPYISESLEDPNEEVEMAARSIIHKVEGMAGESIQEYLK